MHDERRHLSYTAAKHMAQGRGFRLVQIKPMICMACPTMTNYELGAVLLEQIASREELWDLLEALRHGRLGSPDVTLRGREAAHL